MLAFDGVEDSTDAATDDGSSLRMAPEQPGTRRVQPSADDGVQKPGQQALGAATVPPLARAADPEPVLTAPQQTQLARHEIPQGRKPAGGPCQPGIQQMEAETRGGRRSRRGTQGRRRRKSRLG